MALLAIFSCPSELIEIFRQSPEVVIVDSTYKTNRYGLPLFCMAGVSGLGHTLPLCLCLMPNLKESEQLIQKNEPVTHTLFAKHWMIPGQTPLLDGTNRIIEPPTRTGQGVSTSSAIRHVRGIGVRGIRRDPTLPERIDPTNKATSPNFTGPVSLEDEANTQNTNLTIARRSLPNGILACRCRRSKNGLCGNRCVCAMRRVPCSVHCHGPSTFCRNMEDFGHGQSTQGEQSQATATVETILLSRLCSGSRHNSSRNYTSIWNYRTRPEPNIVQTRPALLVANAKRGAPLGRCTCKKAGQQCTSQCHGPNNVGCDKPFPAFVFPPPMPGSHGENVDRARLTSPLSRTSSFSSLELPAASESRSPSPFSMQARCPLCGARVDAHSLEKYRKEHPRGRLRAKENFCFQHRRESAEEEYQEKGYPQIDWETFEERMARHLLN